ncbi:MULTISPECIES: SAM-dependent methyltransferase [Aminobacterium]|jgi:cyclopropane fatty-acyl-phospholipid synthase-like methyltransferase|uniref:SAM-dependent methyltransferase n=1 Tax=Aminobacterium TaxID=81466 RepID=UPI00257D0B38|nr:MULTISPECIES: methyltransferase domain-containing protein [unclassified Aminobacterium]
METKREDLFTREFLLQNMMGPNCIRILDELLTSVELHSGMRVLDLGCGRGLTSIFLAGVYDVEVFATDLWIDATENYERFKLVQLDHKIIPIHADAHELPYAKGFFDAIISIDAYHYFGAKRSFLDEYIVPLTKKGGIIAIAVPGLQKDFFNDVPEVLRPYWQEDMNFYSRSWWHSLWEESEKVKIEQSLSLSCHEKAWEDWLECDNPHAKRDIEMMKAENNQYFDTIGLIATVK